MTGASIWVFHLTCGSGRGQPCQKEADNLDFRVGFGPLPLRSLIPRKDISVLNTRKNLGGHCPKGPFLSERPENQQVNTVHLEVEGAIEVVRKGQFLRDDTPVVFID